MVGLLAHYHGMTIGNSSLQTVHWLKVEYGVSYVS